MRIAMISTACVPVPPRQYGGTELVIAELATAFVALGHEVTTFATGDSAPAGKLRPCLPRAVWPPDPYMDMIVAHRALIDLAHGIGGADVVHAHTPAALAFAALFSAPMVYTVHHARSPGLDAFYQYFTDASYVMISAHQRSETPGVRAEVVHHGIAPDSYGLGDGGGGHLAFLGRLSADKGPHLAIDAAVAAGMTLRLAGSPHPDDREYHARELVHRLQWPGVDWQGAADHAQKQALLGGARALLFPICWDEPFGLVMIESMLCGTPVIAFRRGSVPEIVEDGVTGFIVDDTDEMVDAIGRVDSLDRRAIRARAVARWSSTRMANDYLDVYARAIAGRDKRVRGAGSTASYAPSPR